MKLQKPKFEEIRLDNPLAQIERCARVCYKSEDKIAEGTALKMINMLASKDHSAMLEHGTIYLKCHTDWKVIYPDGNEVHTYSHYSFDKIAKSPYSRSYTDSNSNISIPVKQLSGDYLMVSQGSRFEVTVILTVILPAVLIASGAFIMYRRRKR